MKFKIIIFTIIFAIISGCSFINEDDIKYNNNINISTFIESENNTGNIELEKTDIEVNNFEKEFEDLINILINASN